MFSREFKKNKSTSFFKFARNKKEAVPKKFIFVFSKIFLGTNIFLIRFFLQFKKSEDKKYIKFFQINKTSNGIFLK